MRHPKTRIVWGVCQRKSSKELQLLSPWPGNQPLCLQWWRRPHEGAGLPPLLSSNKTLLPWWEWGQRRPSRELEHSPSLSSNKVTPTRTSIVNVDHMGLELPPRPSVHQWVVSIPCSHPSCQCRLSVKSELYFPLGNNEATSPFLCWSGIKKRQMKQKGINNKIW